MSRNLSGQGLDSRHYRETFAIKFKWQIYLIIVHLALFHGVISSTNSKQTNMGL